MRLPLEIIDPLLVYNGTVWKATTSSPKKSSTITTLVNNEDIEGQNRPNLSTVGADHFSLDSVLYTALNPIDVGPNAYGTTATVKQNLTKFAVKIFPNPTANYLKLDGLTNEMETLEIFAISGEKVWEQSLKNTTNSTHEASGQALELNINGFSNGYYIIRITGKTGYFNQKILIRK
jgi:hypothetical protein